MFLTEAATGQAVEDRRFALKRATNEAHERVERVVRDAGMFDTREGFRRYLTATYEMRARYERLLDINGADRVWADYSTRKIAGLVAQDIADLGGVAISPEPAHEKKYSAGELLGVMYVLEGSSLGARILVKSVTDMGLSASFGARHLFKQAEDRGAWRSFIAAMTASPEPPCHDTVRATFDVFADAYRRAGV
jgi:heme oxygenase (biliverdin-IX-beta and delta-forming)